MAIELRGIYLRALGLSDALAVVHHGNLVLDASVRAIERKVFHGMPLKEAKLLLGKDGIYCKYNQDDFQVDAEKWLSRLTKYSDRIQVLTQSSALLDLSLHPEPLEIATCLLYDLRAEGLPIWAGIASLPYVAKLSSQFCDPEALQLQILPIEPVLEVRPWLSRLNVMQLEDLPLDVRKRLSSIGINRVKDLQEIPYPVLARQFRKSAPLIKQVVDGKHSPPLRPNWPPESYSVHQNLDGCSNSIQLDEALAHLAMQAASRLCAKDQVAQKLALYIVTEDHQMVEKVRALSKPIQAASILLTHLRLMLAECQLSSEVLQVRMGLHHLANAPRRQMLLDSLREADKTGLDSAITRLQSTFGQNSILPASQIQLSREQKVWKAWGDIYGWK